MGHVSLVAMNEPSSILIRWFLMTVSPIHRPASRTGSPHRVGRLDQTRIRPAEPFTCWLLSVGALLLVAPTPAQAQCQGLGNPYDTGTNWGREGANVNTCDDDGWYYGWVQDILTDGYCVVYQYKDDWTDTFWTTAATTCTLNYKLSFNYFTSDHDSGFRICKQYSTCATPGLNWDF